ncbi:MAG: hypothetical protein KGI37_10575 [Alphaproteobacteria bacterium]|nr:hypothetical protein [Alphaproteobacteria bacterium]
MVLLVLTTLMISIIAVLGQIVVAQTAQINRAQNPLMQTMVTWHAGSVVLVHTTPPVFPGVPSACWLTPSPTASGFVLPTSYGFSPCLTSGGTAVTMAATDLSPGYNMVDFSFYSIAFQSNSSDYVLTFVPPPATGSSGLVALPAAGAGSFTPGYTMGDLMTQFARAVPTDVAYGVVKSNGLFQQISSGDNGMNGANGANTSYAIPATIPVGAIGIISAGN